MTLAMKRRDDNRREQEDDETKIRVKAQESDNRYSPVGKSRRDACMTLIDL